MDDRHPNPSRHGGPPLHYLAWFVALTPLFTTHISFMLAASLGHLDWCCPYGPDCYSISATGREWPEKLWFKFGMLPSALALILLWWRAARLHRLAATRLKITLKIMPVLGTFAALCLLLYTLALGEEGQAYRLVRRIGIILSFSLTYLTQLLLTRLLFDMRNLPGLEYIARWSKKLLTVMLVLLATGVLSVILDLSLGEGYDRFENAFEWSMAFMLSSYFAILAAMWRAHREQ